MTESNLFRELEEDFERQRMNDIWRRYGPLALLAAFLIIAATAGYTTWSSWRTEKAQQATAGLLAVMNKPDAAPAAQIDALENFAKSNPGETQSVIAQLTAASIALKQLDQLRAIQIYDAVAHDEKADPAFRQFADLLSVEAQLDKGDPAALETRLQALTLDDKPWRFSAMEDQAYLALRKGDKAKAKQILGDLSKNSDAPPSLTTRAGDVLRSLAD